MTETAGSHNQIIVDQFAKQAAGFARPPGHEDATRLLIEAARLGPNDDDELGTECAKNNAGPEAAEIAASSPV